ncbi:hypothetical protein SAMN06265355_12859 [Actinomadura mexicana]|uniref:Uncharacterized protein n=1 Tax=Actinomadura mexicana TaxID=134959 RepID=A0A239H693_9ACTN|nr:hypothetical protein SAMN06265355_12859 [Actinomadura mexicana]
MRDAAAASDPLRQGRGNANRESRTQARRRRAASLLGASLVSSGVLLCTAAPLAQHQDTGPIAVQQVAKCAPIGPIASRYVDKKEVCRRARKEVLRSLKTGRDPDWGDVFRDSIPKATKRPRHHQTSKPRRLPFKKHESTPTPPGKAPTTGATGRSQPPDRTQGELPPGSQAPTAKKQPNTLQPEPVPSAGPSVHTAIPTARTQPDGRRPWAIIGTGACALAVLLGAAVFLSRYRRPLVSTAKSMFGQKKRRFRPEPKPMSPAPADPPENVPLATTGESPEGPAAEDAARRLVMDALSSRPGATTEFVLSRPDARRLLGIDIGTLQEDRIPGLELTEGLEQTRAFLRRQTVSRRVLITYDGGAADVRELLSNQRGQVVVIALSTPTVATVEFTRDSESSTNAAQLPEPARLAPLSKDDGFIRLMSMPTVARRPTRP